MVISGVGRGTGQVPPKEKVASTPVMIGATLGDVLESVARHSRN
jgi:hypothetical protein